MVGNANGQEVFRIHVDASSGEVTLSQSAAIDHAPGSDDQALAAGKVLLSAVATATDADFDQAQASLSLDLGNAIHFADDVPTLTTTAVTAEGIILTTHDAATVGGATDTASASFASAFAEAVTTHYGADSGGASATTLGSYTLSISDRILD